MRDEIGEMRSEMGQVIGKIDSVSKRLHAMDWRALRWRRLDWALLPHTTRKGTLSFLSLEDIMALNNAMTNKVARPHLIKSYKGMRSPAFDQHVYTDKEDFAALRWVMKKGVDLQGFRLEVDGKKGSGMVLFELMGGEYGENDMEIAEYYAERGKLQNVDEACETETGWTALTRASHFGQLSIVNALLSVGADKDKADEEGSTPLYGAADTGHLDVVEALLSAGADWTKTREDGKTALDSAKEEGHTEIALLLELAGQT